MRIRQVPVAFGMGTLYQSSLVDYGLLAAAALAVALILLLVAGGTRTELRGAGIAAALAACVLLIPLVAALAGQDYYIPRALTPAWIPLAVLIGAACTTRRARLPGAALLRGPARHLRLRPGPDRERSALPASGLAGSGRRPRSTRAVPARSSSTTRWAPTR